MAYAITHFMLPVFFAKLCKSKFAQIANEIGTKELFIIGLLGVIPDIDSLPHILSKLFNFGWPNIHRLLTHNFVIPIFLLLIGLIFYKYSKSFSFIFLFGSFAWASHVALDYLLTGTIYPLFPFSNFGTGLSLIPGTDDKTAAYFQSALDAVVFLGWSWLAIKKGKLKEL